MFSNAQHTDHLLTRTQVAARTGLSGSSIYRAMRLGQFPEPLRIGERAVRWSRRRNRSVARIAAACHG